MERPKMNPVNFRPRKVVDIQGPTQYTLGVISGVLYTVFILTLFTL